MANEEQDTQAEQSESPSPTQGRFEKLSFELTEEQLEVLAPFAERVLAGQLTTESDTRYAVMGNVWLSGDRCDTVDVYLVPAKQYRVINEAIMNAKRSLNEAVKV